MMARVLADMGLLNGEISDEAFDILVGEFRHFLLVGKLTWEDWTRFSDTTKLAAIKAGRANRAELACLVAKASLSEEEHLDVYSEVDGGDAAIELAVGEVVDDLVGGINSECDEYLATAEATQVSIDGS